MEKAEIKLYNIEHLGLVIIMSSGVVYTNQTGGYACLQPSVEGVYVPLSADNSEILTQLMEFFTGSKWNGACCTGIDGETADFIDNLLGQSPSIRYLTEDLSFISVDRTLLHESHEAWVFVNIFQPTTEATIINGFGNTKGVLTWPNSD